MLALVAPHGLGQTTVRGYDSNGAKSNAKACWTKIKAVRLSTIIGKRSFLNNGRG